MQKPISKNNKRFEYCNALVKKFEEVVETPKKGLSKEYYVGVDLGTACVTMVVLDENKEPVAGAYQWASVVKDGMLVDYLGAINIVKNMKESMEKKLGQELIYASSAIPSGTERTDGGAVKNVVESAGFTNVATFDESIASNAVLHIENGAIVDIGGGTTGIAIFKEGKVVYVADEPTGGTHFSLVVAGAYGIPYKEAELFKRDVKNHPQLQAILKPVIDKVASIVKRHIEGKNVKEIYLVGGSSCFTHIETIMQDILKIPIFKPINPLFVTPLGIAVGSPQGTEVR